jgi:hypothetical protein
MGSGWYKTFGLPRGSFWCCTGTGVESFSVLGNSIYFCDDDGLFVNLFIPSEVDWKERGVRIRQETRFPEEEMTRLKISAAKPTELTIRLRIPSWAEGGAVSINGKPIDVFSSPSSYLELRRTWKNGDQVELHLPMGFHLHRLPDNANRASIMYGPLVLAGELGTEGLTKEAVNGHYGPIGEAVAAPFFVTKEADLNSWIKPVEGERLKFHTVGVGRPNNVTLVPFYKLFGERYALYWDIYSEEEWSKLRAEADRVPTGILDSIAVADPKSDEEHSYQGFGTQTGQDSGRSWINTADWFQYDLKVLPDRAILLQCTYAASDTGKEFRLLVDGRRIDAPVSTVEKGSPFVNAVYAVPADVTAGKKQVSVTFRVRRGERSRRLFGCAILKPITSQK